MKKSLILFAAIALIFQGCIVRSLHPFFDEDTVVFRPELLGGWIDGNGDLWQILANEDTHNGYAMLQIVDGDTTAFAAHLFRLDEKYYVDFYPAVYSLKNQLLSHHLLSTHSVAQVEWLHNDNITIRWFDEDWLEEMFDHGRIRIAHERQYEYGTYVLTASTDELQKFLAKYGEEGITYEGSDAPELVLTRKM